MKKSMVYLMMIAVGLSTGVAVAKSDKDNSTSRGKGKFAKLEVGMKRTQVNRMIGSGSDTHYYSTGKGYIPFYFGDDRHRANFWYKGVGCLVFNTAQEYGDNGGGELHEIINDPSGKCHD